jgi:stage II sporulation protein B
MIGWNKLDENRREFSTMEIRKSNRTITVKINGNERDYREETRNNVVEFPNIEEEANHHSKEARKMKVDLEPELLDSDTTDKYEGLTEVAASQEAVDESFDWILPEESDDDIDEYIIAKQPADKKKKSNLSILKKSLPKKHDAGPIKSVLFSILLAIIIGTSFGFLVLKLVITEKVQVDQTINPTAEETNSTDSKSPAASANGSLQLAAMETYIIQGGVFSTMESAKIEEARMKQLGVPAQIIENNGQAFLFLGTADSLEKAKSIGALMKANGIEVFAKAYTLPEKSLTKLTETEAKLLSELEGVYQITAALAADGMLNAPFNDAQLNSSKELLLGVDKQEIQSAVIEQIRLDLVGAIEKIETYQKDKNESSLIAAQQHLLSVMNSYFSL